MHLMWNLVSRSSGDCLPVQHELRARRNWTRNLRNQNQVEWYFPTGLPATLLYIKECWWEIKGWWRTWLRQSSRWGSWDCCWGRGGGERRAWGWTSTLGSCQFFVTLSLLILLYLSGIPNREQSRFLRVLATWRIHNHPVLNDTSDGTDIKLLVEDEEELEAVAEEEDGNDGDEEVGEVLLPPITWCAWCPGQIWVGTWVKRVTWSVWLDQGYWANSFWGKSCPDEPVVLWERESGGTSLLDIWWRIWFWDWEQWAGEEGESLWQRFPCIACTPAKAYIMPWNYSGTFWIVWYNFGSLKFSHVPVFSSEGALIAIVPYDYPAVADCPAMSFVFVCWQINIRNTNQLSWAIN